MNAPNIKISLIIALSFILCSTPPVLAMEQTVHPSSSIGGTGMMFSRTGDQLYENEMSAGINLNFLRFGDMPIDPQRVSGGPYVKDPRGPSDLIMSLYYNYGIMRRLEAGVMLPVRFGHNTLPKSSLERITLDARYLIISPDFNFGLAVSGTGWMSFPSFSKEVTSNEINGGGEIAATLHGKGFDSSKLDWLTDNIIERSYIHLTLGAGYEDYLLFHKLDVPIPWNGDSISHDPNYPEIQGTPFISLTAAAQIEVAEGLLIGVEYLERRWPNYRNDENCQIVLPEVSYTFLKKYYWTVQGGFGMACNKQNDQPQYMGGVDFSIHFPGKSPYLQVAKPPPLPTAPVEAEEAAPPPPTPPPAPPPVVLEDVPHRLPIPATNPMPPPIPPVIGSAMRTVVLPSNVPETRVSIRAKDVSSVKALEHTDATRVIIKTDGPVRAYDDFLLINPNRLAIDIYDVKGSFNFPGIAVNMSEVSNLRWGPHPDKNKVRIVLDLVDGNLPYYTVKRVEQGLEIVVYNSRTMANAPQEDYDSYTISNNRTASSIAKELYHDPRVWRRIAASNPEIYDYQDPFPESYGTQELSPGTKMRIPKRH